MLYYVQGLLRWWDVLQNGFFFITFYNLKAHNFLISLFWWVSNTCYSKTLQGGISSGYKSYLVEKELTDDTYSEDGIALFRVQGSGPENMQAIQVEPVCLAQRNFYPFLNEYQCRMTPWTVVYRGISWSLLYVYIKWLRVSGFTFYNNNVIELIQLQLIL